MMETPVPKSKLDLSPQLLASLFGLRKEVLPPHEKLEEIFQNEYGVTHAEADKPILVTYGLVNCVGIAGFSKEMGIGFTTHYQHNTDVPLSVGMLLYQLSLLAEGRQLDMDVRMAGGLSQMSEHLVSALRTQLQLPLRDDITFSIVEEDVLGGEVLGRDLGINTVTGEFITSYDPLANPYHREHLPPEYQELVFYSSSPSLQYFPQT